MIFFYAHCPTPFYGQLIRGVFDKICRKIKMRSLGKKENESHERHENHEKFNLEISASSAFSAVKLLKSFCVFCG